MNVTVVGLVPETVMLSDIGYDVPHGVVVHIPTERANNSKDLWRAISQRRVFRLQGGPFSPNVGSTAPDPELEVLRAHVARLEAENAQLRAALASKEPVQAFEPGKLDEILRLLQQGGVPSLAGSATARAVAPRAAVPAVVEVETPAFIPATVQGEPMVGRVEVQETATGSGGVSDARNALRKLRQGK